VNNLPEADPGRAAPLTMLEWILVDILHPVRLHLTAGGVSPGKTVASPVLCCCPLLLQGFCGLVLLAISALSTVLNILGGITLGMAWIGLVVYFVTVSSSTVAGFFCGSAMMMFSATTAIMGSSILAGEVVEGREGACRLAAMACTSR
jgi:hypothetical protein